MRLVVENNGLGPAIIESASYIDNGKEYDMMNFFQEAYPKLEELGHFQQITALSVGEAIPEKETI